MEPDEDNIDRAISEAAREMRKDWDSPHLWPRIRRLLEVELGRRTKPPVAGWRIRLFAWRPMAAAAAVVLLAVSAIWIARRTPAPAVRQSASRDFLSEQALREMVQAEQAYLRSIEKLQALAGTDLERARSPLLLSYREKLRLLDAAIADLRANVEQNQFHAYLRLELATLYQEKQRTLQEVLTYAKN